MQKGPWGINYYVGGWHSEKNFMKMCIRDRDESLSTLISYAGGFEADAYTRALRVVRQNGQEYEVNTVKDLDLSLIHI